MTSYIDPKRIGRAHTRFLDGPATLAETTRICDTVAGMGSLDPDGRLLSSLERFPGVSLPGGGTRITNSATGRELPTMDIPFFFLFRLGVEHSTIISSSESSISIGLSTEPDGRR